MPVQPGLCQTWSETPKTGFLTTRLIFFLNKIIKYIQFRRGGAIKAKLFTSFSRDVIWWVMRKLGIDEWLVRLVQSMYTDVRSRVRVSDGYSEEFGVEVGVHQGSVLSPLLFIIVLEALSREFRTGCPWELLYADDLMIIAVHGGTAGKGKDMEDSDGEKGLRMNMGKTKIMESGINLDVLKKSGKYPYGVCLTGVGRTYAILCGGYERWVHKKCSGSRDACYLTVSSGVPDVLELPGLLMKDNP